MDKRYPYDDGNLEKVNPLAHRMRVITEEAPLTEIYDETDPNDIFIGKAICGSQTSTANWQIKRITKVAAITTVTWANGNSHHINIWDDRATLTYM